MMKQDHITKVAEAFRKGQFMSVSGIGQVKAQYDEAFLDERTDFEFEHVFVHLIKDGEEKDFIEIMSVDTEDEDLGDQYAPAHDFTEFFTKAMESKLWYLRMRFDPERKMEIQGLYESYTRDNSIVAFYVTRMPGER